MPEEAGPGMAPDLGTTDAATWTAAVTTAGDPPTTCARATGEGTTRVVGTTGVTPASVPARVNGVMPTTGVAPMIAGARASGVVVTTGVARPSGLARASGLARGTGVVGTTGVVRRTAGAQVSGVARVSGVAAGGRAWTGGAAPATGVIEAATAADPSRPVRWPTRCGGRASSAGAVMIATPAAEAPTP